MTGHILRAHLPELIGWAVAVSALLALTARAVVDGPAYLGGRLHALARLLRRPVLLRLARTRRRYRAWRRPGHGAHRAHRRPRMAALAAHHTHTRHIPRGTR